MLELPQSRMSPKKPTPHPPAPAQLELAPRTWGGRRKGAGRKPSGRQVGVRHRPRERFATRMAVHVTLRFHRDVGNLRGERQYRAIHRALCDARGRGDLRVIHYSVQATHLHLLVEAERTAALSRGMQGLVIRAARYLNGAEERHGRVFADRYHARLLRTPREVRLCLAYVINNARHHAAQAHATYPRTWLDPCSSAAFFDGWRGLPGVATAWSRSPRCRRRRPGGDAQASMPRRPTRRPTGTSPYARSRRHERQPGMLSDPAPKPASGNVVHHMALGGCALAAFSWG
jgi:REP element-mobilizing transposase RayT